MKLEYIIPFLMIPAAVVWCVGVMMSFLFHRLIRRHYPDIAKKIAPGLMHKTIGTDIAGMRFLFRREYANLDRPGFVRFCEVLRAVLLLFLLLFMGLLLSLFVYMFG